MKFQCKVFDKNGNLKQIIKPDNATKSVDNILQQKSTQRAIKSIGNFHQARVKGKVGFYDKDCIFCGRKFHPRHKSAKYCSSECQKRFYKKEKGKDP